MFLCLYSPSIEEIVLKPWASCLVYLLNRGICLLISRCSDCCRDRVECRIVSIHEMTSMSSQYHGGSALVWFHWLMMLKCVLELKCV